MAKQSANSCDGNGDARTAPPLKEAVPESGDDLAGINWRLVQGGPHLLIQVDKSAEGGFAARENIVTVATLFNVNLGAFVRKVRRKKAAHISLGGQRKRDSSR